MGMVLILRQLALGMKMGLALICILCLGFFLSHSRSTASFSETTPPFYAQNSKNLPAFYLSFQPRALPLAFANLPAGPLKHQLGKLMLRYGQEQDWMQWFQEATQNQQVPGPEILNQLYNQPELAPSLAFLPPALQRLQARSIPWYAYLPRLCFHRCNQFDEWLLGDSTQGYGFLQGNLGFSQSNGLPVLDLILPAASKTLLFSSFALVLGTVLGLLLSVVAVRHQWPGIFFILASIVPSFLIGGFVFLMFDRGGAETPAFANNLNFGSFLLAYKLPLIALTLINTMVFAAHNQTWILAETLRPFFQTALAKGLNPMQALCRHALRAALPLMLTFFVQRLPLLLSGTVVIEVMFGIPGFGRLAWLAVLENDQPLVLGCLLISALAGWASVYLNSLISKNNISYR